MSTIVRTACTDCGWTGSPRGYRSQAQADFAYRQHSCEKTRRDRASAARGRAADAAVDRTPKTCGHKVANHQHGTYVMYKLDHCRCLPCTAACSQYNADRGRRQAYGTWEPFVDARPATEHLRALSAAGMGYKRVAAAAGLDASHVYPLLWGRPDRNGGAPRTKARRATVEAILAVPMPTVDDLGATVIVDPTGTRRRLEALIALGWTVQRLADDHGLDRQALDSALLHVPVQARTARAVRAMFEAVGDTPPPQGTRWERAAATRSRNLAAARGWVVPAEWDEADLDDPYAAPPERTTGKREAADLDEWCFLVSGGVHPEQAARRLGVSWNAIEWAIKRTDHERARRLLTEWRAA